MIGNSSVSSKFSSGEKGDKTNDFSVREEVQDYDHHADEGISQTWRDSPTAKCRKKTVFSDTEDDDNDDDDDDDHNYAERQHHLDFQSVSSSSYKEKIGHVPFSINEQEYRNEGCEEKSMERRTPLLTLNDPPLHLGIRLRNKGHSTKLEDGMIALSDSMDKEGDDDNCCEVDRISSSNSFAVRGSSESDKEALPAKTPPATPIHKRHSLPGHLSRHKSMTAFNRKHVGVKMKVKLEFIDDVSHEMHALVYLSLHYEDEIAYKFVTNQPGFCVLDPEKEGIFVPVVNFIDTRVCDHIEGFKVLVNTLSGTVFIYRIYRIVSRNVMNLKRFPFDRQIMKCHMKSFTAVFLPWSAPAHIMPSGITSDTLWRDNDCVVECDKTLWNINWVTGFAQKDAQPSVYKFNFGISRISLFYIVNFFLIKFLLVITAVSCTAIHFADFASRSSITFTILLTIISFKFIMTNYTPTINYLTLLDYYNIVGTVLIVLIILENFVVASYPDHPEFASYLDNFLRYPFGVLWIVMHVILFVGSSMDAFYEDWSSVISADASSSVNRVHNKEVTC